MYREDHEPGLAPHGHDAPVDERRLFAVERRSLSVYAEEFRETRSSEAAVETTLDVPKIAFAASAIFRWINVKERREVPSSPTISRTACRHLQKQ